MDNDIINFIVFIGIILFMVGAIIFGLLQPKFEADNFNRCTGGHATYWTAAFTELRITECNK